MFCHSVEVSLPTLSERCLRHDSTTVYLHVGTPLICSLGSVGSGDPVSHLPLILGAEY